MPQHTSQLDHAMQSMQGACGVSPQPSLKGTHLTQPPKPRAPEGCCRSGRASPRAGRPAGTAPAPHSPPAQFDGPAFGGLGGTMHGDHDEKNAASWCELAPQTPAAHGGCHLLWRGRVQQMGQPAWNSTGDQARLESASAACVKENAPGHCMKPTRTGLQTVLKAHPRVAGASGWNR